MKLSYFINKLLRPLYAASVCTTLAAGCLNAHADTVYAGSNRYASSTIRVIDITEMTVMTDYYPLDTIATEETLTGTSTASNAVGLYDNESENGLSFNCNFDITSNSSNSSHGAYGFEIQASASTRWIVDISTSHLHVTNTQSGYAYGLTTVTGTINKDININSFSLYYVNVTSGSGTAAAVILGSTTTITASGQSVLYRATVSSTTGNAYAMLLSGADFHNDSIYINPAIKIENVTVTTGGSEARGIRINGGSIIDGNICLHNTTVTNTGSGSAVGFQLYGASSVGDDVYGSMTIKANAGNALGLDIWDSGVISGNIGTTYNDYLISVESEKLAEGIRLHGSSSGVSATIKGSVYSDITAKINVIGDAYGINMYEYAVIGSGDSVVSGDITVSTASGTAYGISMTDHSYINGDVTGSLNVSGTKAYGIYMDDDSFNTNHSATFTGNLTMNATYGDVYAYLLGRTSDNSVGYYNAGTQNSAGLEIDWANLALNITATSANSHGFVVFDGGLSDDIGGDITINADNNIAYGFYLYEKSGKTTWMSADVSSTLHITGNKAIGFAILGDSGGSTYTSVTGDITGDMVITSTGDNAYAFDLSRGAQLSGNIGIANATGEAQTTIEVNGGSSSVNVVGISLNGETGTSNITGNIYADFILNNEGTGFSYGLNISYDSIGNSNGSSSFTSNITVTGVHDVAAIRLTNGATLYNDYTGAMNVTGTGTSTDSRVYGVYADAASLVNTGDSVFSGHLTMSVSNGVVYGYRLGSTSTYSVGYYNSGTQSSEGINIDWKDLQFDITNTGSSAAYGINLTSGATLSLDELGGSVRVTSNGSSAYAYAFYMEGSATEATINAITADLTATSNAYGARAIFNKGNLETSLISGDMVANSITSSAYGIYNDYKLNATRISGNITATSTNSYAYGIFNTGSNANFTGDIAGDIEVNAGSSAYGIFNTGSNANFTGDITGDIVVNAGTSAYGINIASGADFTGNVGLTNASNQNTISVTGGSSSSAYGIRLAGSSASNESVFTGNIDATIKVSNSSTGNVYGIHLDDYAAIKTANSSGSFSSDIQLNGAKEVVGLYLTQQSSISSNYSGTISITSSGTGSGIYLTEGSQFSGDLGLGDEGLLDIVGQSGSSGSIYGIQMDTSDDTLGTTAITGDIIASIHVTHEGTGDAYGLSLGGYDRIGETDGSSIFSSEIVVVGSGAVTGIAMGAHSAITSDYSGSMSITAKGSELALGFDLTGASLGLQNSNSQISSDITLISAGDAIGLREMGQSNFWSDYNGTLSLNTEGAGTGFYLGDTTQHAGDIAGSIAINSVGDAQGIIVTGTATLSGDVSSSLAIESSAGDVVGIQALEHATITGDITGNLTLNSTAAGGTATGIELTENASISGNIGVQGGSSYINVNSLSEALGIKMSGSTSSLTGDLDSDITVITSAADGKSYALWLTDHAVIGAADGSSLFDSEITAKGYASVTAIRMEGGSSFNSHHTGGMTVVGLGTDTVVYGVYADANSVANSSSSTFSGDLSMSVNASATAYGYVLNRTVESGSSVGYYNAGTQNSSGLNIDWANLALDITNTGGSALGVELDTFSQHQQMAGSINIISAGHSTALIIGDYDCDSSAESFNLTAKGAQGATGLIIRDAQAYDLSITNIQAIVDNSQQSDDTALSAYGFVLESGKIGSLGIEHFELSITGNSNTQSGELVAITLGNSASVASLSQDLILTGTTWNTWALKLGNSSSLSSSGAVDIHTTSGIAYAAQLGDSSSLTGTSFTANSDTAEAYAIKAGHSASVTGTNFSASSQTGDSNAYAAQAGDGLSLTGESFTASTDAGDAYAIQAGDDATIQGITFTATTDTGNAYAIQAGDDATIRGITFTATTDTGNAYALSVGGGHLSIDGSSFSAESSSGKAYAIYLSSSADTISMSNLSELSIEVNSTATAYGYYGDSALMDDSSFLLYDEDSHNSSIFTSDGAWNQSGVCLRIHNAGGDVIAAAFSSADYSQLKAEVDLSGEHVILAQYHDLSSDSFELQLANNKASIGYDSSASLAELRDSSITSLNISMGDGDLILNPTVATANLNLVSLSNTSLESLTGSGLCYTQGTHGTTGLLLSDKSSLGSLAQVISIASDSGIVKALDVQSGSSVGSISGSLIATSNSTRIDISSIDSAYALVLGNGASLTGDLTASSQLSGESNTISDETKVYGLYTEAGSSIEGSLLGTISASGAYAYAMTIGGEVADGVSIAGSVTATSTRYAQAITLNNTEIDSISSSVSARVSSEYGTLSSYSTKAIGYYLSDTQLGSITGDTTVSHESAEATGLHLSNNSSLGDYSGNLSVSSTGVHKAIYGIYLDAGSSLDNFTGTLTLTGDNYHHIYGYTDAFQGSDVSYGFYSKATESSDGMGIDWKDIDFNITNTNTNTSDGTGYATAISLSKAMETPTSIGGTITVETAGGRRQALGVNLANTGDSITAITADIHIDGGNNSAAVNLSGDTSLSSGISGNIYVESSNYTHGIVTDGTANAGTFSGSMTMIVQSATNTVVGYSNSRNGMCSYAFYNNSAQTSAGFILDWQNLDLTIESNVDNPSHTYASLVLFELATDAFMGDWSDITLAGSLKGTVAYSDNTAYGVNLTAGVNLNAIGASDKSLVIQVSTAGDVDGISTTYDYGDQTASITNGIHADISLTGQHYNSGYNTSSSGINLVNASIENNGINAQISLSDFYQATGIKLSNSTLNGDIAGNITLMGDAKAEGIYLQDVKGSFNITAATTALSQVGATGLSGSSFTSESVSGKIQVAAGLADTAAGFDSEFLPDNQGNTISATGVDIYDATIQSLSSDISVRSLQNATGLVAYTSTIDKVSSDISVSGGESVTGLHLSGSSSLTLTAEASLSLSLLGNEHASTDTSEALTLLRVEYVDDSDPDYGDTLNVSIDQASQIDLSLEAQHLQNATITLQSYSSISHLNSIDANQVVYDSLTISNSGTEEKTIQFTALNISNESTVAKVTGDITIDSNDWTVEDTDLIQVNAKGIEIKEGINNPNSIGSIESNITISNAEGDATGVDVEGGKWEHQWAGTIYTTSSVESIEGDISVSSTAGDATGLNLRYQASVDDISGDISATGAKATGIYMDEHSSLGDVSGNITATGTETAYGIYSDCSVRESEEDTYGSIGTIGGDISASVTHANATAESAVGIVDKSGNDLALNFTADQSVSISATYSTDGGTTTELGYAIVGEGNITLTLADVIETVDAIAINETPIIAITGNISAAGDLSFESGHYEVNADTINSNTVNYSDQASVTYTASTKVNSDFSFDMTNSTAGELGSLLMIADGASLTGVGNISITLSDTWLEYFAYGTNNQYILIDGDAYTDAIAAISRAGAANDAATQTVTIYNSSGVDVSDQVIIDFSNGSLTLESVPEPNTVSLSLLALTALLGRRRRKAV